MLHSALIYCTILLDKPYYKGDYTMRKKLQEKMFEISYILELIISLIVAVAVLILGARLFIDMFKLTIFEGGDVLVDILDKAMTLAIGVEFIKMLCKHTPDTVIEVLAFAIARQLIVLHTTPLENLITIISIAVLFATRKFLLEAAILLKQKDLCLKKQQTKSIKKKILMINHNYIVKITSFTQNLNGILICRSFLFSTFKRCFEIV